MALDSQLLKYKSAGVKQITNVIQSIPQANPPQGARVLCISSKKGRVNYPILVQDWKHYLTMFDDISDADERRGNFSARSAYYMLMVSPIYVINLRNFDDKLDKAQMVELSTNTKVKNGNPKEKPYSKLFNTSQFWKVDKDMLLDVDNTDKLLVFGNLGTKDVSIFVRKSKNPINNTITLESWYKNLNQEIPSYVNPTDKVADWYVDVYLFENSFGTASKQNPKYGYCFDEQGNVLKEVVAQNGTVVDGLDALTRIVESGHVSTFTGCLIQGFKDNKDNSLDIVKIFNSAFDTTSILCNRNEIIFDNDGSWYEDDTPNNNGMKKPFSVDFKGHNLCNITQIGTFDEKNVPSELKTLSYELSDIKIGEVEAIDTPKMTENLKDEGDVSKNVIIKHKAFLYAGTKVGDKYKVSNFSKLIIIGDVLKPSLSTSYVGFDGNLASIKSIKAIGKSFVIYGANTNHLPIQPIGKFEAFVGGAKTFEYKDKGKEFPLSPNGQYHVYPKDHVLSGLPLAFNKKVGSVATGVIHNPTVEKDYFFEDEVKMTLTEFKAKLTALTAEKYAPKTQYTLTLNDIDLDKIKTANIDAYNEIVNNNASSNNIYEVSFDKELVFNGVDQDTTLDKNESFDGKLIESFDGKQFNVVEFGNAFRVNDMETMSTYFKPHGIKAYRVRNSQFLDGSRKRQTEVLDVLLTKSLRDALQNKDLIKWNYILDGFRSYIEPSIKYQTKTIAEDRILGRSIFSYPPIKDFVRSQDPYFSQEINGDFDVKYIPLGGNLELPYTNTFSVPNDNGWYAYGFGDELELAGEEKTMPSAPIVSNLFAQKYKDGKPFKTLAGDNGIINYTGIVGVGHVFNEKNDGTSDRDYLEPFGYNSIVKKDNGIQIYSNRTNDNIVQTPMSSIHTSEVVMYIQERINNLLERQVFKAPTRQNQMIIIEQANMICDEPKNEGAIYDYINIMVQDKELIANRYAILDTTIYDQNNMEIIVHRTTIDTITNSASFESR